MQNPIKFNKSKYKTDRKVNYNTLRACKQNHYCSVLDANANVIKHSAKKKFGQTANHINFLQLFMYCPTLPIWLTPLIVSLLLLQKISQLKLIQLTLTTLSTLLNKKTADMSGFSTHLLKKVSLALLT
jgi:hypothetical protein